MHPVLQDEATMHELTADEPVRDIKGWMQRTYAHLFCPDLFACLGSDDTLMRIHSSAEEYEPVGEELFVPGQVHHASFPAVVAATVALAAPKLLLLLLSICYRCSCCCQAAAAAAAAVNLLLLLLLSFCCCCCCCQSAAAAAAAAAAEGLLASTC